MIPSIVLPCVIGMGPANQGRGPIVRGNNCPECSLQGIHVGLPRYQEGWLCYLPLTGGLRICLDVAFDEKFYSTNAHSPSLPTLVFQDPKGAC